MAEYLVQGKDLTAVADAIRQKGGTEELLQFPDGFVSAVEAIEAGSGDVQDYMERYFQGQFTEYINSNITSIGQIYLFYRNSTIQYIDLPNVVGRCSDYAFYYSMGLKTCKLPKLTSIGAASFMYAIGLEETDFRAVESIDQYGFRMCEKLARLDLPSLKSISSIKNFGGCTRLKTLIFRNTEMVTLESTDAFENTPIASGTGYIYVPADLISTYQADSVWSTYAGQFRAIEDYPDI